MITAWHREITGIGFHEKQGIPSSTYVADLRTKGTYSKGILSFSLAQLDTI